MSDVSYLDFTPEQRSAVAASAYSLGWEDGERSRRARTSIELADGLMAVHRFNIWRVMDRRALRAVYGAAYR